MGTAMSVVVATLCVRGSCLGLAPGDEEADNHSSSDDGWEDIDSPDVDGCELSIEESLPRGALLRLWFLGGARCVRVALVLARVAVAAWATKFSNPFVGWMLAATGLLSGLASMAAGSPA